MTGDDLIIDIRNLSLTFETADAPVHALHSGLADGERTRTWLAAARGEPSSVTGRTGIPIRRAACPPGSATVAEARTKVG